MLIGHAHAAAISQAFRAFGNHDVTRLEAGYDLDVAAVLFARRDVSPARVAALGYYIDIGVSLNLD
jgi:hypothetical protein